MGDEGHQLGNHGYWHRKLHRRSPAYVRDDLTRGTEEIERASGIRPRHFRAPHGFLIYHRIAIDPLMRLAGHDTACVAYLMGNHTIAARMFRTLAIAGINIEMISTSEIRITCIVGQDRALDAVRALHSAFDLDQVATATV